MDKNALIRKLKKWDDQPIEDHNVVLCFLSYNAKDGKIEFHKIHLKDDLLKTFQDIGIRGIGRLLKNLDTQSLTEFHPTTPISVGEQPFLHYVDTTVEQHILPLQNNNSISLYDHEKFPRSKLHGYCITLENDACGKVHFLSKYSSKKEISRQKILTKVLTNSTFDSVDEPTFLFDRNVDCMILDENAYLFKKNNFLSLFKYYDSIKTKGKSAATQITTLLPMTNADKFIEHCENNMIALTKLTNIAQRPHFNSMTLSRVQQLKDEGFSVDIETETVDGDEEKIIYSKDMMWSILKVMDDDYVKSAITGEKYEAIMKKNIV